MAERTGMNQIAARDTKGGRPHCSVVVQYLCVRHIIMISAVSPDLIWLAVIVAMVMAGFVAAAAE